MISGVIRCTLLMVQLRVTGVIESVTLGVTHCELHAMPLRVTAGALIRYHIDIMRLVDGEPRSTAGFLLPSQYLME